MSIKLTNSDEWFMVIGVCLIFIGLYELIDNNGYNKHVGLWLLGGFAVLIFTFWDAASRKPDDTDK